MIYKSILSIFYVKSVFQWSRTEFMDNTWSFPITYTNFLTAVLLGFVIVDVGRQNASYTNSYIAYRSDRIESGHTGTIAIGY